MAQALQRRFRTFSNMQQHLTGLRLIGALMTLFVISPAFAGYAAAATCAGDDTMPCCAHTASAPVLKPACCRIEPAPAPAQVSLKAPAPDRSGDAFAGVPVASSVPLIVDYANTAVPARAPTAPGVPLYLSFSTLRR